MIDCNRARELMPWYATGTLSPEDTRALTAHLAECAACRDELAVTIRLAHTVNQAIAGMPSAPDTVRSQVVPTREVPVARVDLGSFLLGFSLGLSIKGNNVPVNGDLRLLGRRVNLFTTRKKEV